MVLLDKLPHFVTLTYPDVFPADPREWKRDLDNWLKRVLRQFPESSGFWKMELKPRQSGESKGEIAPHFHLLMWGLHEEITHPRGLFLARSWMLQSQGWCTPTHTRWRREVYEDGDCVESEESSLPDDADGLPIDRFVSRRRRSNGMQRDVFEYWLRDEGQNFHRFCGREKNASGMIELRMWVALTWADVVGSDDPRHVRAGTQTAAVQSSAGVMSYAAKYIGKVDQGDAGEVGRWWGMFNRSAIPWGELVCIEATDEEAHRLRRVALRYVNSQRRITKRHKMRVTGDVGLKVFCNANEWLRNLPQLVGGKR